MYILVHVHMCFQDSKKAGQQEESASDLTKECLKKKDEEEEEEEAGSSKAGADVPALVKTGSIEQTLICQICQVHRACRLSHKWNTV